MFQWYSNLTNWADRVINRTGNETRFATSDIPEGFFPPASTSSTSALSLSPFYAALRLFQSSIGNLPMVVYEDATGGRVRAKNHPSYYLLHAAPNPSMTRATLWEINIRDLYLRGEFFNQIIWSGNGKHKMTVPIPFESVLKVRRNAATYKKEYIVATVNHGEQVLQEEDVIHVMNFPDENCADGYGVRGISLLKFASQSLSLHSQVRDAGAAFFRNAVRPANYVSFPGNVQEKAAEELITKIDSKFAGSNNRGKSFYLTNGGKLEGINDQTAEEARIVEMLNNSVPDIARWFGVSELTLGSMDRGTYSNLGADNESFYSRSLAPVLDKIELEYNRKLFGIGSNYYAEFLVEKILRVDPKAQADIDSIYLAAGVYEKNEVRRFKNMPDLPDQTETDGGAVQDTAMNGAQVTSLLLLADKVAAKQYPAEAGIAILKAAFPAVPESLIAQIVNALESAPAPAVPAAPPAAAPTDQTPTQGADSGTNQSSNQ